MNVELPDDLVELAAVIRRAILDASAGAGTGAADLHKLLHDLGVLDLLGPESADADNAHLATVVALEAVAHGGGRAPVAETIWTRGRGINTGTGFVAIASDARMGDDRLVPYGARAATLLVGGAAVAMPAGVRPAPLEIDDGHVWLPPISGAAALAALDQAFAWRAAAASTVGNMARATEMAIGHARERVQFGKPLASFQALQFRLAECHWRLLGLRLLVREAAWRADRGDARAGAVSALAWLYAREVGRIVTKHAHQVHGAIGFTRELGLTGVTGATAALRAIYPAAPAAAVVRAARGWEGSDPPSTVLGGFRTTPAASAAVAS
jgi:hypothetical protein